uniref:Uncharacterized protein n=1 Tax=Rhizophagus irregularis (strain DAOM 181602 / DAOM 197198 / MUCL 43194) TaxID=747089 RepID=U9TAW3_RHIID
MENSDSDITYSDDSNEERDLEVKGKKKARAFSLPDQNISNQKQNVSYYLPVKKPFIGIKKQQKIPDVMKMEINLEKDFDLTSELQADDDETLEYVQSSSLCTYRG